MRKTDSGFILLCLLNRCLDRCIKYSGSLFIFVSRRTSFHKILSLSSCNFVYVMRGIVSQDTLVGPVYGYFSGSTRGRKCTILVLYLQTTTFGNFKTSINGIVFDWLCRLSILLIWFVDIRTNNSTVWPPGYRVGSVRRRSTKDECQRDSRTWWKVPQGGHDVTRDKNLSVIIRCKIHFIEVKFYIHWIKKFYNTSLLFYKTKGLEEIVIWYIKVKTIINNHICILTTSDTPQLYWWHNIRWLHVHRRSYRSRIRSPSLQYPILLF